MGGEHHGAMTCYALQAIRQADYEINWRQIHPRLRCLLDEAGYPQPPQLEGNSLNKQKQIFAQGAPRTAYGPGALPA